MGRRDVGEERANVFTNNGGGGGDGKREGRGDEKYGIT